MTVVFVMAAAAGMLVAQEKPDSVLERSLDAQRESVRKQAAAAEGSQPAKAAKDGFFTIPWPAPLPVPGMDDCDPMPKKDLETLIHDASAREKMKPDLIEAVVEQESGDKPCAISQRGAMGLMQLMPDVAARMHVNDPFDPRQNMDAGVKLLKQLLAKYKGDLSLALSAYNAGENRVDQAGGIPDIPETQNYVDSISRKLAAGKGGTSPAPQ